MLILGGGAKSIGLYAAGLAVAHGAGSTTSTTTPSAGDIAESFGARPRRAGAPAPLRRRRRGHLARVGLRRALRALAPGGICTAVGYYLGSGTRVPLMRMYATDATLRLGVSHARAVLPELLAFVARTGFPAERVTTLTADWDDAPSAYTARTTKVVLQRERVQVDAR